MPSDNSVPAAQLVHRAARELREAPGRPPYADALARLTADLLDDLADGDDHGVVNPWALALAEAVLGQTVPQDSPVAPPPPGSTRDQLPAHLLALLAPGIYLSTACETARRCDGAAIAHPDRAGELAQWRDRMHQSCRLNHKFTGRLCHCRCHRTPPDDTPEG